MEEYIAVTPVVAIVPWFFAGALFPIAALPGALSSNVVGQQAVGRARRTRRRFEGKTRMVDSADGFGTIDVLSAHQRTFPESIPVSRATR